MATPTNGQRTQMSTRIFTSFSGKSHSSAFFAALLLNLFAFDCGKSSAGLDVEHCGRALGMESGRIGDEQLSVSSSFDPLSTGPMNARLNSETGSGAWCPQNQINATSHEWIQVELKEEHVITGVRTQGRWDKGRGMEYPQGYMIEYWRESLNRWARYRDAHGNEIIRGNSDTQNAILRLLDGAIIAKFVRLIPVSESVRTVCLRFELFGCEYKESLLAYAAPSGSFADALDLRDSSYDGTTIEAKNGSGDLANSLLRGGIGRLFDGTVGEDNFEERSEGWVGWRPEELLAPFVSIQLLFSKAQNFSALLLHTSNFRRGGAHLFRLARVHFAPLGDDFSARVVQFDVPADLRVETARWLRIPIPHRIAIKVRLELYFDVGAKLLLISEIRSESEPASKRLHTVVDEHNSILPAKSDTFTVEHAEEDEQKRWLERSCLLIAIICSVVLLSCALLCFCFFLLFRFRRPRKLKQHSPRSPTTLSSTSCSSDQSNSALLQLLLKSARRTMETARIPHKKIPPNHFFRPKTKMPREREEGKELMDIAKLVIEHNGGNRALISRSVEEESDEYADPEEPTKNASEKRSFVACRPANIHFASGEAAMMRRALLRNLPSSEYSLSSFAGNESIHSVVDSSRYRCTPTMSQFSPFPPPLPTMPPPPRRRQ